MKTPHLFSNGASLVQMQMQMQSGGMKRPFDNDHLRDFGVKKSVKCMATPRSSSSSSSSSSRRLLSKNAAPLHPNNSENDDAFYDYETDVHLSHCRGLVLDLTYRPVHIVGWRRAICLEFLQKADVLQYYNKTVSSLGGSFYIPAVLKISSVVQIKRRRASVHLSRKNVFGRDLFTCQYCCSTKNLTIDHVLPVSRGGEWTWENLVTACSECNSRKANKTLQESEMKLIRIPKAPKQYDAWGLPLSSTTFKVLKSNRNLPTEWADYLSDKIFV